MRAALKWDALPNGSRVAAITYVSAGARGCDGGCLWDDFLCKPCCGFMRRKRPW